MAWLAWAFAAVALVLLAAKSHGREVRLLREAHCVLQVDFRRDNGPVVEGIWRRDRWVFWTVFGCAAALDGAFVLFAALRPADLVVGFAATLVWGSSLAFLVAGMAALARRIRVGRAARQPQGRDWAGAAQWWAATGAAWGLSLALAWA